MINSGLLSELHSMLPSNSDGLPMEILSEGIEGYTQKCQIFNTRYQFRPTVILFVETAEQVSTIVKYANAHPTEIHLSARSGGHDHAGECSGTATWQLDFSKMNSLKVLDESDEPIIAVGPGARFEIVKPFLDQHDLGIPHGTCQTVAVAGYTMGGGWGPWTRRYGMGCERLWGATIVLGNGEIVDANADAPAGSREAELLWALRGGGGLSYGLVTELRFKTFRLPDDLCSFNLHCKEAWPDRKALEILQCWENAIRGDQNPQLIGTNLKVGTLYLPDGQEPNPNAVLDCVFNGYFAGTEDEAREMITTYFGPHDAQMVMVQVHRRRQTQLLAAVRRSRWTFASWDRQVTKNTVLLGRARQDPDDEFHQGIRLEDDGPAPHKITSRIAEAAGWDDTSRIALICALQSSLVAHYADGAKEPEFPIYQYITLGAITGPYYATYDESKALPTAFPYKDRLFTIQFQAWWDQYLDPHWHPKDDKEKIQLSILENRPWVNRAEDWIDTCRDAVIPSTSGAFISFKDSSIPTKTYFAQAYERLCSTRSRYTADPNLVFRAGKTIP